MLIGLNCADLPEISKGSLNSLGLIPLFAMFYRIWGNLIKIWKPLSTEDLLCLNSILALAVILRIRFFVSYIKLRKVAARYSGTQERRQGIFSTQNHTSETSSIFKFATTLLSAKTS